MSEKHRDFLAVERTELANERTLLAYWRTGAAIVALGAAIAKLFSDANLVGVILIVAGIAIMIQGTSTFYKYKKIIVGKK